MLSLYSISPHSKEFTHALAVGEGAAFILYGRSYALDDLQGPSDCQWMIPGIGEGAGFVTVWGEERA